MVSLKHIISSITCMLTTHDRELGFCCDAPQVRFPNPRLGAIILGRKLAMEIRVECIEGSGSQRLSGCDLAFAVLR